MMNLKKLFASVASVMILASTLPTTVLGAGSYSAELQGAYDYAYGIGITTKSSIDDANMLGTLKRVDMAKMMVNYATEVLNKTVDTSKSCSFSDVAKQTEEMQGYMTKACQLGLMGVDANGNANATFNPEGVVTRAQFGTVLSRALYGDANEGGTPYYAKHLQALKDAGIMTSISAPNAPEVRGYVMLMMKRGDANASTNTDICKTADNLVNCSLGLPSCPAQCTSTDTTVKAGGLNVSLDSASASDGTQVPANGTIKFAVVDFAANSNDVSLQTVSIKKVGLATIPSNVRVWFEKDGIRVSGKAAFTSDGTAVLSFAPTYVVKAGEKVSFDLYVQLADGNSYGTDYQFASTDVYSSAQDVNGSFTTPKLRTANYTVAPVEVDNYAADAGTFNVDTNAQEIGAFKMTNNYAGSDTRDVDFQSITLRQNGNGSLSNLSNITLVRNGVVVAKNPTVDGKDITFSINDTVKQGTIATYYVKANVNNVDYSAGDTYILGIRNTSDVNASETTSTAFRSTVSLSNDGVFPNVSASTLTLGTYTFQGANINFTKDSSVDLSTNYAAGSDNVVLMQGTITTKSSITLEDIPSLNFTSSTGMERLFSTIYLKIGNSTFSYSPTAGDTYATFLGTVTINSSAAVKMYGKLRDTAPAATVKFEDLKLSEFQRAEYVDNSNTVAGAVGSIAGVNVGVQNATLNVTKSDALGDTAIAAGVKGLLVYGMTLTSDQGNGATVSNLVFNISTNNAGATTTTGLYNNAYATLYINGVAKQSKTINAATVTFDSFNSTVSKNNPVTMEVKVDFADAFAAGNFRLTLASMNAVDTLTSNTVSYATPAGALFTIGNPGGALASSDKNPLAQLFLSPSAAQKLVAFKMTASNDNVRLYDVSFTGTNLDGLSNFKLVNSDGTFSVAATTASASAVTFTQIANSPSVLKDKSDIYYVVADVNSNTSLSALNIYLASANIKSSNGSIVAATGGPLASNTHATSQNTMTVQKADNSSKLLTTSALRFSVTAAGKNSVILTGLNFTNALAGYTGSMKLVVYKNSIAAGNKAGETSVGAAGVTPTGVVALTANNGVNSTVDAGSTVTYIVTIEGALVNSTSNSQDWSVSLSDVYFGGFAASTYNNVGAFPITETK